MRVCGSGGMGFIVSQVSEFRLGESGIGPAYSQRPAGAHEGRRIPGLRYASSGATIASSLREERQRVEFIVSPISESRCGPPAAYLKKQKVQGPKPEAH